MSCIKREKTGKCSHHQCEYGVYGCVDVWGGFCEVGEDCVPDCEHSWSSKDKKKCKKAFETFKIFFPEMEEEQKEKK